MIFNIPPNILDDKLGMSLNETKTIPDNTDYDDLTTAGDYVCGDAASSATMTNAPSNNAGHRLFVFYNAINSRITQVALLNASIGPSVLVRNYTADGWSGWNEPTKRFQSQIASFEGSWKATQAYSAGDYILVNGVLYKATTSISSGATLTVGTNIERANIGSDLKLVSVPTSITVSDIPTDAGVTAKKIGPVIYISGGIGATGISRSGNWTNLGRIQSGYRPSSDVYFPGFTRIDSSDLTFTYYTINTSGYVRIYSASGTTLKNAGFNSHYIL